MDPVDKLEDTKIKELDKTSTLDDTTICSTMHCYNRAKETNDPLHPPFCEQCQDRKDGKKGPQTDDEIRI